MSLVFVSPNHCAQYFHQFIFRLSLDDISQKNRYNFYPHRIHTESQIRTNWQNIEINVKHLVWLISVFVCLDRQRNDCFESRRWDSPLTWLNWYEWILCNSRLAFVRATTMPPNDVKQLSCIVARRSRWGGKKPYHLRRINIFLFI